MPKAPAASSALSLQNVNQVLESVSQLTPPEKLLLYLKLPTGQPVANPLKSPVNPLGSRFEITQTINWVRTHFVEDKNVSLPKQNIYAEYSEYCSLNCMKPLSTADFGKVMKQVFPEVRPRRLGTRGNSRYCYSGLGKSRSLSCPYLPVVLGEEVEIKPGKKDAGLSGTQPCSEEKSGKNVNGASMHGNPEACKLGMVSNNDSSDSTKHTGVSQGDVKNETILSPVSAKGNPGPRKRKLSGPKKDQLELKGKKQSKKIPAPKGTPNPTSTTICDIEHYSPVKDKSLTNSYIKLDLDIDLNSGKPSESSSKLNRSYSVELPSNICRTASRTVSVDVISDYGLSGKDLETVCNPFSGNLSVSNINLQEGINLLEPTVIPNLESDSAQELNSFVVASQKIENKLPLPRLRPVKISGPNQVAKIIILPPNVINQTSGWPPRQYKPIQPRPEKDSTNLNSLDKTIDPCPGEPIMSVLKDELKDEPKDILSYDALQKLDSLGKDSTTVNLNPVDKTIDPCPGEPLLPVLEDKPKVILNYDALPKLDSLGKDALDTYLNGEGNSQELDEELLQYFKPDFSSSELAGLSNQTVSLSQVAGFMDVTLNKITFTCGNESKLPVSKSSVPFYQPVSMSEVHPPNRCTTEFQMSDGPDLVLPSPASSVVLKRQASFDSGVRDLETPLNIPPSPNTRCKLFNFTPISPRPSSPLNGTRESSKSSCDTSIQSPFVSPRTTPSRALVIGDSATSKYPPRFRSVSTSCKSNSLIGNPSRVVRKTQDLPSFNDLVKMSKPKSSHKLLSPVSPLSTSDSPVFSFSEVRKDLPTLAKASSGKTQNGHQHFSDPCFSFDFYRNTRSKSVPAKEMPESLLDKDQAVDAGPAEILEKPFLSADKSPIVEACDDNLDKMLTYYKEDVELDQSKLYLDVLNGESSFNSGHSSLLCNDNDPIVLNGGSSGNELFTSRRRDTSLQSFLHSDQMPTPLDCLLGDVDIGLNGLSSDAMDVFSPALPPIITD